MTGITSSRGASFRSHHMRFRQRASWFGEVIILAQHLVRKGLLEAFALQLPLVQGRFGRDEPLDDPVRLSGYAVSGERT